MNVSTELRPTDKPEEYQLFINGLDLGIWHRSQLRQHIEDIDNEL